MGKKYLAVFLFLASVLSGEEKNYQVIFTSNRQGEIEPCDCQTNRLGGLGRLSAYLEETKKNFKGETFFFDSGDTFFGLPQFPKALNKRELSKAKKIAETYKKEGLDFFVPGERDFALGPKTLSALLEKSGAQFAPLSQNLWSQIIEKGRVKLGVIAIRKEEPIKTLIEKLRGEKVDQILLLSHLNAEEDKKLAGENENILILGSHSLTSVDKPLWIGKSVRVEAEDGGKSMGRMVFDQSAELSKAKFEYTPLSLKYEKK